MEILEPLQQLLSFYYCKNLEQTSHFYEDILGLQLVRDQRNCKIFKFGDSHYIGFCERECDPQNCGVIITFVVDDVDGWASRLEQKGVFLEKKPAHNPEFNIYHCFFRDPSGYLLEIQRFDHPLE